MHFTYIAWSRVVYSYPYVTQSTLASRAPLPLIHPLLVPYSYIVAFASFTISVVRHPACAPLYPRYPRRPTWECSCWVARVYSEYAFTVSQQFALKLSNIHRTAKSPLCSLERSRLPPFPFNHITVENNKKKKKTFLNEKKHERIRALRSYEQNSHRLGDERTSRLRLPRVSALSTFPPSTPLGLSVVWKKKFVTVTVRSKIPNCQGIFFLHASNIS